MTLSLSLSLPLPVLLSFLPLGLPSPHAFGLLVPVGQFLSDLRPPREVVLQRQCLLALSHLAHHRTRAAEAARARWSAWVVFFGINRWTPRWTRLPERGWNDMARSPVLDRVRSETGTPLCWFGRRPGPLLRFRWSGPNAAACLRILVAVMVQTTKKTRDSRRFSGQWNWWVVHA